jgi:pimeloyl-ACP methyl ester carboxylesterase
MEVMLKSPRLNSQLRERFMVRPGILATAAVAVLATGLFVSAAHAQGQPQQLKARDGHPVFITYYSPAAEKTPKGKLESPVVVLLHGTGGNRLQWDKGTALPTLLVDKGYAVISVDLRKHGESVVDGKKGETPVPADFGKMVQGDLAAVKQFIYEEHQNQQLNMNKMAIVAVDMSAPLALAFAELDWKQAPFDDSALPANRTPRGQDVRCVVLISPDANSGTVRSNAAMNFLKGPRVQMALQILVGDEDTAGKKEAETLHKVFTTIKTNEERVNYFAVPRQKDHGMALVMKDRNLPPFIVQFLDTQFAKLGNPWQDRRSRLDR